MDLEQIELHAAGMDAKQVTALLLAYADQTNDLKQIKDTVYTLLNKIGFINQDGTFRENINMKQIMDIAMKATMQTKKFKEDMHFISDCLPLIEKYKHL